MPLVAMAALIGTLKLTKIGDSWFQPESIGAPVDSRVRRPGLRPKFDRSYRRAWGGRARGSYRSRRRVRESGAVVWRQLIRGQRWRALLDLRPLAISNFTVSVIVLMCLCAALFGALGTLRYICKALFWSPPWLPACCLAGCSKACCRLWRVRSTTAGSRPLVIPGVALTMGTLFWLAAVDENTWRSRPCSRHPHHLLHRTGHDVHPLTNHRAEFTSKAPV